MNERRSTDKVKYINFVNTSYILKIIAGQKVTVPIITNYCYISQQPSK